MKILVCGDRNWSDYGTIEEALSVLIPLRPTVIHGGCRGADQLAGEIADALGMPVVEMKAEWAKYGRAAGPIRNQQMLDEGPAFVLAFHDDLERSRGTADMVRRAKKAGVRVHQFITSTGQRGAGEGGMK